jgi:hypothetical protein
VPAQKPTQSPDSKVASPASSNSQPARGEGKGQSDR